ncbi:MAG: GNAT family N-acetyltransferase [Anaerolineae bacterium]
MIQGNKVRLRAIEREDLSRFVRWLNDPEVVQYLTIYTPFSMAEEERWFERQLEDDSSTILAIETLDGTHIGNVGLHKIDWKNSHAELGIFIGEKEYWDQGYGSDAVMAMLNFAFNEMNLHRVSLGVYAFNKRAIRCYEKCGFRHEGTEREVVFKNGNYHDHLIMGILRHEFNSRED